MSADHPSEEEQPPPSIAELLARMATPTTPQESLEFAPEISEMVGELDTLKAVRILSGLMTAPQFQANFNRLDWAVSLVMGLADGDKNPTRDDLDQFLNIGLPEARVDSLEDPIEDFFVESLPTARGDFLFFPGRWQNAASCTETVIQAFERLPRGEKREEALRHAYALLRLSHALVGRAGLERRAIGDGHAQGQIDLPSEADLTNLGRRPRFSRLEIEALGIDLQDLEPFIQSRTNRTAILNSTPGNSPIEFQPLLRTEEGIIVAVPTNLCTAVRALLIDTAVRHGLGRRLKYDLMWMQALLLRQGNFRLLPNGPVREIDGKLIHDMLHELSGGRYVHVIQSLDGFEGWAERGFAGVPCTPDWVEAIMSRIRAARAAASARAGFVEGMTVWLTGGWGAGRSFEADRDPALADWPLITLEPADAVVLANCEVGKLSDLCRLQRQLKLVELQGFDFVYANGFLNLFQWWRVTDHALIPPHETDVTPPMGVNFDTNLFLDARREAAEEIDRRSVQHPDGSWRLVGKFERGALAKKFGAVYGSLEDVLKGKLVAVIPRESSTWWVEFIDDKAEADRDVFETWRTVLLWAALVMPAVLREFDAKDLIGNIRITVSPGEFVAAKDRFNVTDNASDEAIDAAIELTIDPPTHSVHIVLGKDWYKGFYRPDNYAEISLGTTIAWAAAQLFGSKRPRSDFRVIVQGAAGSADFRHRHAFRAERAIDRLTAMGLIKVFKPIPLSAAALAKCGSAWVSHPREKGVRIRGKDDCIAFLGAFVVERQASLQAEIRRFDRKSLVVNALESLQSAITSENHWGRSARALRAIYGVDADFRMSLEAVTRSNGVIRADSILAELAATEAAVTGGRLVGQMDLEELQAKALQLFLSADLLPAFYADRIEAEINLSPTGDVLYSHNFEELAIKSAAEVRHEYERDRKSTEYVERFTVEREPKEADTDLKRALIAEYGVPSELVASFSDALVELSHERGSGVFVVRRSELIAALNALEDLAAYDTEPLVDRLILPARNGWTDLSEGCHRSDFDLSRFDRKFSLIGRPLVALSGEADPELVVAPGAVERSLFHNISGAIGGTLQNEFWRSKEMRSYCGGSGHRVGKQFNRTVAGELSGLGLRAWPSAKPAWCLSQPKSEELSRLGDIDVFAVSADGRCVWVVEAKDLKMCRTMGEAARRLMTYRGEYKDGKADDMMKHLRRVQYLRSNAGLLVERFKLPGVPRVCGVLVVNGPQPMQQLQRETSRDATVVMLDRIGTVPWAMGWPESD